MKAEIQDLVLARAYAETYFYHLREASTALGKQIEHLQLYQKELDKMAFEVEKRESEGVSHES